MKTKGTIKTPTGKTLTPQQYIARVRRMTDPPPCEEGHFGCAAWVRGPCAAEIAAEYGEDA